MQLLAFQARAIEGTRPSIVTRALSTKTPKRRPRGDPCNPGHVMSSRPVRSPQLPQFTLGLHACMCSL